MIYTGKWQLRHMWPKNKNIQELQELCSEAQYGIFKFVRLSLSLASSHFGNDTKIIFLIRDPRAIMHSRNKIIEGRPKYNWCNSKSCSSHKILCQQHLQDFQTAKWLQEHSPENFKFV
jgi:hypothetical protein